MPLLAALSLLLLAGGATGSGLQFLTMYGWDPALLNRTCNVWSVGSVTDLPLLEGMRSAYGARGMLGGPDVFRRGDWTFESGGIDDDWEATTAAYVAAVRPSCANRTVASIFFGDELVCSGVPLANLTSVADKVKQGLSGTGVKLYTNECGGGLNQGTVGGCYKATCKAAWAWQRVPASLDWLSVDAYNEGNRDGAAEVALVRRRAERTIFPRMAPHQSLVVVPGVFANTPEGCSKSGLRCPLAAQQEQVIAKLRGFAAWAEREPRIVGMHAWVSAATVSPRPPEPLPSR